MIFLFGVLSFLFLSVASAKTLLGANINFGTAFNSDPDKTAQLTLSFLTNGAFQDQIEVIQLVNQSYQKTTILSPASSDSAIFSKETIPGTSINANHFQFKTSLIPQNQSFLYRPKSSPGELYSFSLAQPGAQITQLVFFGNFDPLSSLGTHTKLRIQILLTELYRSNIYQAIFHVGGFPGTSLWSDESISEIQSYLNGLSKISANIPYMVTGSFNETGSKNGSAIFNSVFLMPGKTEYKGRFYSIDYSEIHLISMDFSYFLKEPEANILSDFTSFFKDDISSVKTQWIVVYHSLPFYCSSSMNTSAEIETIVEKFTALYAQSNVDLVISAGECMHYERSLPIDGNGDINPQYLSKESGIDVYEGGKEMTVYLTEGAAGTSAGLDKKRDDWNMTFTRKIDESVPGLGILSIEKGKLRYRHVSSIDGQIIDEFRINKNDTVSEKAYRSSSLFSK